MLIGVPDSLEFLPMPPSSLGNIPGYAQDPVTGRYYRISNNAPVASLTQSFQMRREREERESKELEEDISTGRNDAGDPAIDCFDVHIEGERTSNHKGLIKFNECISKDQITSLLKMILNLYRRANYTIPQWSNTSDLNDLMLKTQVHHFKPMYRVLSFTSPGEPVSLDCCSTAIIFQSKVGHEIIGLVLCPEKIFSTSVFEKLDSEYEPPDVQSITVMNGRNLYPYKDSLIASFNDRLDILRTTSYDFDPTMFESVFGKAPCAEFLRENAKSSSLENELDSGSDTDENFNFANSKLSAVPAFDYYNPFSDDIIEEYMNFNLKFCLKLETKVRETVATLAHSISNSRILEMKTLYQDTDEYHFQAPVCIGLLRELGNKHFLVLCYHPRSPYYPEVEIPHPRPRYQEIHGLGRGEVISEEFRQKEELFLLPYFVLVNQGTIKSFDMICFQQYRLLAIGTLGGDIFIADLEDIEQLGRFNYKRYSRFGSSVTQLQFIQDDSDLLLVVSGLKSNLKLYHVHPRRKDLTLMFQYEDFLNETRPNHNFKVEGKLFAIISGSQDSLEVLFYSIYTPKRLHLEGDNRTMRFRGEVWIPYNNPPTYNPMFCWLKGSPGKSWEKEKFIDRLAFLVYSNSSMTVYH